MVDRVLFSSNSSEWETPDDFFQEWNKRYKLNLDVCASKKNHKLKRYFTKKDDALKRPWKGRCWMNPPYGRNVTGLWVQKAYDEVFVHRNAEVVVCLLPSRTDTRWFHDLVWKKAGVTFVRGRLKFVGAENGAPFPSLVAVFGS
jgi:phage N-6-adenine-methyltransferase